MTKTTTTTNASTEVDGDLESTAAADRLLRLAMSAARVGSWDWDLRTQQVKWSESVEPIFGLAPGEFNGTFQGYDERIYPEDRDKVMHAVDASLRGETPHYAVEHRVVWPDGSLHWIEARGDVIRDAAGQPLRMIGTASDITQRKEAEGDLLASKALLRQLIEYAPAAIAMFDKNMNYLQVSARWLSDYRLEGQNLIGRSHYEVFPDIPEHWKEVHRRALAGAIERCDEDPFPRADGTLEWLQWEVRPFRNANGEIAGIIMLTQLITERKRADTERKRAEAAIVASEARLRRVIASPILGIAFGGADGVITDANDECLRLVGYTREDLRAGRIQFASLMPSEYEPPDSQGLRNEGVRPRPWEVELVRKDGKRLPVLLGVSTIDDDRGQEVVFLVDLTERRALERRIHHGQRLEAVGRLAAGIAHDFNNILAAITMTSDLLKDELEPGHAGIADAIEIRKAADRATRLVRQLLAFSRQRVTEPRVIDLNELVTNLETMLRRLIGEDVALATVLAQAPGVVRADPSQIEQVIINLVVNARDAMPKGGTLTIETANVAFAALPVADRATLAKGAYVMLSVADTGVGMNAQTKAKIFEPFYTTKAPGKGTGLGLSTVYGVVRQSGGAVDVTSESGRGSVFRVFLPRVDDAQATISWLPESIGGTETILLVEDDPAVRLIARKVLAKFGYKVFDAPNAQAAMDTIRNYVGTIDLLLTDVVMPGGSGRTLATQALARRPKMRVLFMSGYADDTDVQDADGPGFAYLQKPFSSTALAHKLRAIFDED